MFTKPYGCIPAIKQKRWSLSITPLKKAAMQISDDVFPTGDTSLTSRERPYRANASPGGFMRLG